MDVPESNIEFDGNILLEVKIKFDYLNYSKPWLYPTFKEISNIIPKKLCNHIYRSGDICYVPPNRPIYEKWEFIDFVNAVDSMINNFLSKEYIGIGFLRELEHGQIGLDQYRHLVSQGYRINYMENLRRKNSINANKKYK